jgi:hypothetical protein
MKQFSMNFKNVPHPGESMELFDDIEDDREHLKSGRSTGLERKG